MKLSPYIPFPGNAREAFRFYAETFGGKITAEITYGQTPAAAQTPAALHNSIIHISLQVGTEILMGCDSPPERYQKPAGTMLMWAVDELAKAEKIFKTLSTGGAVVAPWSPTFFAEGFGMCVDRFGTHWMVGKLLHPQSSDQNSAK
ncbi:MAG TPA: VOC family protein [Steroidobacteraceae bacterium]|jgi:PhnB protein|nr:VOC family protein [Steroidobacteraceae bacterium]